MRSPKPPHVGTSLQARAPKTTVELQTCVDRVAAELISAAEEIVRVPIERTISDGRGVLLTLSKSSKDIFGQTVDFELPKAIRSLVHDGLQPFAFGSYAPSTRAVSRLVERARRLRVDVFIAYDAEQFAELRRQWRV